MCGRGFGSVYSKILVNRERIGQPFLFVKYISYRIIYIYNIYIYIYIYIIWIDGGGKRTGIFQGFVLT